MRLFHNCIVFFIISILCLLQWSVIPLVQAAQLGRLFSKESRNVENAAQNTQRLESNLFRNSESELSRLRDVDRDALMKAESDFILKTPDGSLLKDLELLRLARTTLNEDKSINRLGTPFSNFPNFKVKLASNPLFDDVIMRMATVRLRPMLESVFNAEQLKVVPLGLADDAIVSLHATQEVQELLGRSLIDKVGPLSNLSNMAKRSPEELNAALMPYQGKTIVLIGHVPKDKREFFVFDNQNQKVYVDIRKIEEAAESAGVNLIPLGCDSAKISRIGIKGSVNSANLAIRIRQAVEKSPNKLSTFLSGISAGELDFVADSMTLNLFDDGIVIIDRKTKVEIARLLIRNRSILTKSSNSIVGDFEPCFLVDTRDEFKSCTIRIQQRLTCEKAKSDVMSNIQTIKDMNAEISSTEVKIKKQKLSRTAYCVMYALIIFPLWFIYLHCLMGIAVVIESRDSLMGAFSRKAILETISQITTILKHPIALREAIPIFCVPLLFIIFAFGSSGYKWDEIYLGLTIGFTINSLIQAFLEKSIYPVLSLIPLCLIGALSALLTFNNVGLDHLEFNIYSSNMIKNDAIFVNEKNTLIIKSCVNSNY
jgi:hypothetical protein